MSTTSATSSSLPKPAATVTALLALTTQFAQPPNCTTIRDLTVIPSPTTTYDGNAKSVSTVLWPALLSDPGDRRYAACQPPGWDIVVTESRFTFSPAVCPRNWTARAVSEVRTGGRVVTEAYCCERDHSLYPAAMLPPKAMVIEVLPTEGASMACVETWTAVHESSRSYGGRTTNVTSTLTGTLSRGDGEVVTQPFTRGLRVHPAWKVAWEASDMSTLTPAPPASLPVDGLLPLFVPGEGPDMMYYQDALNRAGEARIGREWLATVLGLAVGIPVGVGVLCGACCCWACCGKVKRKVAAARTEEAPNTGVPLGALEGSSSAHVNAAPGYHAGDAPPPYSPATSDAAITAAPAREATISSEQRGKQVDEP